MLIIPASDLQDLNSRFTNQKKIHSALLGYNIQFF